VSKLKIVEAAGEPFSIQGAPAGGNAPATGVVVRPDRQSREEIEKQMGGLEAQPTDVNYREYIDKISPPGGPPGGYYNNPYVNRGGSFTSESIDDHFLEVQKEAAPGDVPQPAGVPGAGPTDMRNFSPGNQPGFIVISQYLTPDDNWIFTNKCSGIIAESGGTTSHGAVVARAMGIPAIVGAEDAARIQPGDTVTMDPNTGRIDVNGGDPNFEMGEVMRAANETVRFVWSAGNAVYSPVTEELTEELAALPYDHVGQDDRSHAQMMEYMMMEDTYDFDDGTIGVIYDDGRAIYYEPITDEPALENWLRSNFPNLVEQVVYKQTAGGIYQPQAEPAMAHVAGEEDFSKAPKCPECESHSYDVVSLPGETKGEAELKCLACGTEYGHKVILNPKDSKLKIVEADGLGVVARCGNCGAEVNLGEVNQNDDKCPNCQMPLPLLDDLTPRNASISESIDEHFIEATMQKGAPYPGHHDEDKGGDKDHMKGAPEKVNEIYHACMRDHEDYGKEKCAKIAWAQYKKMSADSNLVLDTNGQPINQGELYLMHSHKYPVPDLVRIVNITPQQIEAHIDSDTSGMFPIEINPAEYINLGYSFEPYEDVAKTAGEVIECPECGNNNIEPAEGWESSIWECTSCGKQDYYELFEKNSKTATRRISLTPKRQQELINENMNGRARNFDKLNLDGTHYVPFNDLIPSTSSDLIDDHFMW
jgi:phosphohistidine swiveling domain-containing protein/predicted Zn-ribbon and HTH transcriptional regulator